MTDSTSRLDGMLPVEPGSPPENVPTPTAASTPTPAPSLSSNNLDSLPPEQAVALFAQNPVAFVREIVNQAAQLHLADLKDEAELRGAITAFRRTHPEFDRFQPFIMQEVASLIQDDPDGVIDPWNTLLEKGLQRFQQKFKETVYGPPAIAEAGASPPYMETAANRQNPDEPPVFTREQIARMSMPEFLKQEAAINEAMKEKRIR
ncbi:MAG: hypothetical protein K0Q50_2154 [Vampirovibrio sp.]|jgi:hypothetical protein|nr:hypothetical protein [Vampirovibrio sp.]